MWPWPSRRIGRGDSRMGSPSSQARRKMSAVTSIAVTRGLPHAARSSDSVSTATGALLEQRVAVADPPAALAADDASLVDAVDLVQPPLAAAVAHDGPPVDALVQPAASEEHRPGATLVRAPVAAALAAALAVQAALVAADEARAGAARRADHPHAEHRPGPGAARGPRRQPRASVGLYGTSSPSPTSRSSHGGPALAGACPSSPPATAGPQMRAGARGREGAIR